MFNCFKLKGLEIEVNSQGNFPLEYLLCPLDINPLNVYLFMYLLFID